MELTVRPLGGQAAGGQAAGVQAAGVQVAALTGEVDLHSAAALRERLDALLAGETPRIVLDLDGVGFLDSTGLGTLVAVQSSAAEKGGAFALVCTQQRILKLFAITGLQSVFRFYDDADEAVANLP